jgi:acetoin utilization protein AcuB
MLVADRMTRAVVTTTTESTLHAARRLLNRHKIRQLPVLLRGRLAGIVTDRDLRSASARAKTVKEVMTAKPTTIAPHSSVDEAARLLRTYKIGALPVVEGSSLCGIITGTDVLDAFVDLSGVAEPTYRIVLSGKVGGPGETVEKRVRAIVEQNRGELKWLHCETRKRPPLIHLRLKVKRVDDVVTALEGAGLEVQSVVAPSRRP